MINIDKSTTNYIPAQIAGLHYKDSDSEFIGATDTLKVSWVCLGKIHPWNDIPKWVYNLCQKKFFSDHVAMEQLGRMYVSQDRQIEIFIYHLYGGVDSKADIVDGVLQPSENFRHTKNHPSRDWDTKNFTIDGVKLNDRDLFIIDCYKADLPDKMIAWQLEIAESTLDFHKRNLMHKLNCQSKMGVLVKALQNNI